MQSPAILSANASVNHFTSDATPNLLMKPDYSQVANITSLDLAPTLLADLGWALNTDPIATTTLITSDQPDPSVINTAYTVNVTVSSLDGLPTGTVTIRDGTEPNAASCTANIQSQGQASCVMTSTFAGNRTLTATYPGAGVFQGSFGTESHSVTGGPTTTLITSDRPDPSQEGQQYAVNVRVTSFGGTPSGNVMVSDGVGSTCMLSLSGTPATGACIITSLSAGIRTLTATYGANAGFLTSSATEQHTVTQVGPGLISNIHIVSSTCNGMTTNVAWNAVNGATQYEIEQVSVSSSFTGQPTIFIGINQFYPLFSGFSDEKIQVRACAPQACSEWSTRFVIYYGGDQCG